MEGKSATAGGRKEHEGDRREKVCGRVEGKSGGRREKCVVE